MSNDESFSRFFTDAARHELRHGMRKVEHCVAQLSDEQIWHRPRPGMNSIANLMLHLSGNMRQWIIAGVGGTADVRNRPAEFSDDSHRPKETMLAILQRTVDEADAILAKISPQDLVATRRIQGFDTDVTAAVWQTIPHFRGHTQEIIHMTREILGDRYKFFFVPTGAEQISAKGPAI